MENYNETLHEKVYSSGVNKLNNSIRKKILGVYTDSKDLTIATVRSDGWPQANVVGFVNIGLDLYIETYKTSSKMINIERDSRVSITTVPYYNNLNEVLALSLAGQVEIVTDKKTIDEFHDLLFKKYPELLEATYESGESVYPDPDLVVCRIRPKLGSVLDYTKQMAYADFVEFTDDDFCN